MTEQELRPAARRSGRFEWQDYFAMVAAAFSVLWAPIALFVGGFFLFYAVSWLWLHVLGGLG